MANYNVVMHFWNGKEYDNLYVAPSSHATTHEANGGDMITVSESMLASSAVTEAKLASNAVTSAKIASSAVTSAKIASSAVTEAKLAANAVTTAKINNSAVTEAKLADKTISKAKIKEEAVIMGTASASSKAQIIYGTADPSTLTGAFVGQIYLREV